MNRYLKLLPRNTILFVFKRYRWKAKDSKLFADFFGMSQEACAKYRIKMKIPPLDEKRIKATAELCDRLNFSKQDWLKYPLLVKELAFTLEQEYMQMKEGGFVNIDAGILANYQKCIKKRISFLKRINLIPADANVAENFVRYLRPKPNFLISDLTDENTFEKIHNSILTRYLNQNVLTLINSIMLLIVWRFNTSDEVTKKFYELYTISKVKSFENLSQNMAFAEELGFTSEKILKCGYLLTVNSKNTRQVLSEMPIIAGADIKKAMRQYPKLIGISIHKYIEIYNYLKNEQISDEAIQKCMNIFTLSSQVLKSRFDEIKLIPEMKVLQNNPQFLKLLIHHNQSRSRLSFLKQVKLKCATTALLCSQPETFKLYVHEGKDCNNIFEITTLLKSLSNSDVQEMVTNLKKHRYFRNVPLVEIEKSYKYLTYLGFGDKSIAEVVQIVLYPRERIEDAYAQTKTVKNIPSPTKTEKLNLMIYFIERRHHFTGNGVWRLPL